MHYVHHGEFMTKDRAAQIEKLNPREAALLRPNMYIGTIQTEMVRGWVIRKDEELGQHVLDAVEHPFNVGFFKLFDEIISNSIGEYIKTEGKFFDKIEVWVDERNSFRVKDYGRGVPVADDPKTGKPQVELAFTELHAGSNFKENDDSPGMNGVGAALANYFSTEFIVETNDGDKMATLTCTNNCSEVKLKKHAPRGRRGTDVRWKVDEDRFEWIDRISKGDVCKFVYKRLVEAKTCFPKLRLFFNDEEVKGTMFDFLSHLPGDTARTKDGRAQVGVFLKRRGTEDDISFVNGLNTYKGGSHLLWVKKFMVEEIGKKIKRKFGFEANPRKLRDSLFFVVSITGLRDAKFDGQNKTELKVPEGKVKELIPEEFLDRLAWTFVGENKGAVEEWINTLNDEEEQELLKAASKKVKKDTKKVAKFVDAVGADRSDTTLFLMEGDSARSQFCEVRDQLRHGVYPLRGRILNVYGCKLAKVLANDVVTNIATVLGLEFGKDPGKMRFERVALLTDADPDGDAITAGLVTFFYRFWPSLFNDGRVVKVLAPLAIAKKGGDVRRYYSMEEFNAAKSDLDGWTVKYYKGLAGLPKEEYADLLNAGVWLQLKTDEAEETAKTFELLFGKSADARKEWLGEGGEDE